MFERIHSGVNSIPCACWPVRMHCDFLTERVRRVDRRLHLLERERLKLGDVVKTPGRAVHLHPIRAGCEDLPDGMDDRIYTVGHDADRRGRRGAAGDRDSETATAPA